MLQEKLDENALGEATTFWLHAVIIGGIVLFVLLLLFLLLKKAKSKADTFLFVGLNDAGKTVIFSRLINPHIDWETYTSMNENIFDQFLSNTGVKYQLVDYPGAERLRSDLFSKWLHQKRSSLKGIIFVVDSGTFHRKVRDVAELLYDVVFESGGRIPLLIACNKQDVDTAKSYKIIESSLEREFGLINCSREAALTSTSGETTKRVLSNSGQDFKWADAKNLRISFAECSAGKGDKFDINEVQQFIDRI